MSLRLYVVLLCYAPRWLFYLMPMAWRHRQFQALCEDLQLAVKVLRR